MTEIRRYHGVGRSGSHIHLKGTLLPLLVTARPRMQTTYQESDASRFRGPKQPIDGSIRVKNFLITKHKQTSTSLIVVAIEGIPVLDNPQLINWSTETIIMGPAAN